MVVVSIDPNQGTYISSCTQLQLREENLILDSGEIRVGEKTTLNGWFNKPCEFLGFIDDNAAIFFLGKTQGDLFSGDTYFYDVTYIFGTNRIGKSYKAGTFRDVFLRNKNGNYFWK